MEGPMIDMDSDREQGAAEPQSRRRLIAWLALAPVALLATACDGDFDSDSRRRRRRRR
jgi:hypothetical protein